MVYKIGHFHSSQWFFKLAFKLYAHMFQGYNVSTLQGRHLAKMSMSK